MTSQANPTIPYGYCHCGCGEKTPLATKTRNGNKRDQPIRYLTGHQCLRHGHGRRNQGSATYRTWQHILQRCENPNSDAWEYYGGRGITVCEQWHKFENFLADVGVRPSPELSLDRIDNDGNYEPGNVRWATRLVQQNNQRIRKTNTSGYVGVSRIKRTGRWLSQATINRAKYTVGSFASAKEAAIARQEFIAKTAARG